MHRSFWFTFILPAVAVSTDLLGVHFGAFSLLAIGVAEALVILAWLGLEPLDDEPDDDLVAKVATTETRMASFEEALNSARSDIKTLKDDALHQIEARKEFLKRANPGDPWQQG